MGIRRVIQEMIGRVAVTIRPIVNLLSVDWTRVDYKFWSWLRRGKQTTYELGGLFAKPIADIITSWTLGKGFSVSTGDKDTDAALSEFAQTALGDFIRSYDQSLSLGDAYVVVNSDATLTLVPPNCVEVICEPKGSLNVVGYKITTQLSEQTVTDEYRLDGRTLTVKQGASTTVQRFPNLIGMLPVIHIANDAEINEVYGHPVYEALLRLFAQYDDVLTKSLDAVKVMGHPIPVAEGLDDPQQAMELNATSTETYTDADGESQTRPVIDFARLPMMFLGKGGSFKFAAPGRMSEDASVLLKKLFYLMLEHSQVPEWVWGGAVQSSKASVDAQTPAWVLYVQGRRLKVEPQVRELFTAWLRTAALFTPKLKADLPLAIEWASVVDSDRAQTLAEVTYARETGLITDETALRLLALVDDPAAELELVAKAKPADDGEDFDKALDEELKEAVA